MARSAFLSRHRDFFHSQVLVGDTWDIVRTEVLVIMWEKRGDSDFFYSLLDAESIVGALLPTLGHIQGRGFLFLNRNTF